MKKILLLFFILSALVPLIAGGKKEVRPGSSEEGWEEVETRLKGLSFDLFVDSSYRELTIRTPELVTEMGLDDAYGLSGDRLNDLSEEFIKETEKIQSGILALLDDYPADSLSAEQQTSRDVLGWYLEDHVSAGKYRNLTFPVTHFIIGEPASTELFFTDVLPLENLQDAENYLTRLEQIETKMSQLARGMEIREEEGILLPATSIQWTLGNLLNIINESPRNIPYYSTFATKISILELDPEQEDELNARALTICESSVIPGYRRLEEVLSRQTGTAKGNLGAWSLPGGDEYYLHVLSHHTTTDFTPEEIHQRGYQELERIHQEMRTIFERMGIDPGLSVAQMYRKLDHQSEKVPAGSMVERYSDLIEEAEEWSIPLFEIFPQADVIVKGDKTGGYYLPGTLDGSRPGMFFAAETTSPEYKMPTLTFHETVPGHHFQITIAAEAPISPFQKGNNFLGYTEGWALYAENLMAETGYYTDDPAGNLGRLQAAAFRASRLVIDTGIHFYKWDFEKAVDFFTENTGYSDGYGRWEVLRYLVWPGQATAYMTGMLKILELRDSYRNIRGEGYDIREFHTLMLDQGGSPLSILEKRIGELR